MLQENKYKPTKVGRIAPKRQAGTPLIQARSFIGVGGRAKI